MENYKIMTPSPEISKLVQEKLFELGYTWLSGKREVQYTDFCFGIKLYNEKTFICFSGRMAFDSSESPEISYQDFLNLNTNNNQLKEMDDISLKLAHSPKKAKNITVGSTYTGIYVDAEDTQVDKIEDAEYFLCVNDRGKEARYSIGLFEAPAPVVPPRRIPSYQEIIDNIVIDDNEERVYSVVDGVEYEILDDINPFLEENNLEISCGVKELSEIDDLFAIIHNKLDRMVFEFNVDRADLGKVILKKCIEAQISAMNVAFVILSTTLARTEEIEVLNSIVEERGGTVTDARRNPNSGNEIKVWTIQV